MSVTHRGPDSIVSLRSLVPSKNDNNYAMAIFGVRKCMDFYSHAITMHYIV